MQKAMKGDVWSKTNATTHIVRWAVNVNDWTPTEKQWTKAINSVQVCQFINFLLSHYRTDIYKAFIFEDKVHFIYHRKILAD